MRQEFTFNGTHCDAYNVAFVADHWPMAAKPTVNKIAVSGQHGTIRFRGRSYGEAVLSGTLYLLDPDNEVISYSEMLRRTADIAAWLCPEGRKRLVLDAMPDRFYMAEVEDELTVATADWGNGSIPITFTLQPFAYATVEDRESAGLTAQVDQQIDLFVSGNQSAPVGAELTASSSITNIMLLLHGQMLGFAGLSLSAGQTLQVAYDLEMGEIMRVQAAGAPGLRYLRADSVVPFEAKPGRNALTIRADGAGTIRIQARGRWI